MKEYFINSRGEIQRTEHINSEKHQKRIAFGNAYETREEAKMKAFMFKTLAKAPFEIVEKPESAELKVPKKLAISYCPTNSLDVSIANLGRKINEIIDYLS